MKKERHFLFELLEYMYYQKEGKLESEIRDYFEVDSKERGFKYEIINREMNKAAHGKDNIFENINSRLYLNSTGIALYQDYIDLQEARKSSLRANIIAIIALVVTIIVSGAALINPVHLSDDTISKLNAKDDSYFKDYPKELEPFCYEVCLDYGNETKSKVWSDSQVNYCLCYEGTEVVSKHKAILNSDGSMETY